MVDTNIRKIITHLFFNDIPQKEVIILDTARQLVPKGKSWQWHQALMDYGAIELPKLNSPLRSRKISIPFKLSDRYFRGKILDDLRETQHSMSAIQSKYHKVYALTLQKVRFLLDGFNKRWPYCSNKGYCSSSAIKFRPMHVVCFNVRYIT